ncbi:MAG: hypothetical protein KC448_11240 [Yoonia sp.]|nr:hypothetical protein [Yoonia sp.]
MTLPATLCARHVFGTLLVLLPMSAQAEMTTVACSFTTECMDSEPCQATSYDLSFPRDNAPQLFALDAPLSASNPQNVWDLAPGQFYTEVTDISGTFKAVPIWATTYFGFNSFSDDATQRLLSVKDGLAYYSIHMLEEEISMSYRGVCTETVS